MLRITPEAGLAIKRLAEHEGGGGLRLEATDGGGVTTSPAAIPDETDLVVTEETTGARVVLDSLTAELVDDRTLDADDTVEGEARFRLTGQDVTSR
ncbi:HesB/YadR/YfhF-family protein [Actinophytocola gossypii]|uniref:HesB/YadR/YfhF-family protein n=1 Tax=Actinophytocola gossypii TaxID=2812003 RepID=A0ABT2J7E9_9PSEU|nr:HesB/YadR/YfhF-family protein [Actinophytocola gossypii]MCT2583784.1 HesB/YadR/YfhF-family protein [Actinophytocola gossypii]